MAILRHEFGSNVRATVASFGRPDEIQQQAAAETDAGIRHVWVPSPTIPDVAPLSMAWFHRQFWRVHGKLLRSCGQSTLSPNDIERVMDLGNLNGSVSEADCALQIGGDNYSLDYGLPIGFMRIDRHLWRQGLPVALWGASVGPFEAQPRFAAEMIVHLRRMNAVFVRESESYDYLRRHEVTENLRSMSDPAFAMEASKPDQSKVGCRLPQGAIGFNFSPLMARYVTNGDRAAWTDCCADIVKAVSSQTGRPVVLIPHVTSRHSNDHKLLMEVAARTATAADVVCVGDRLSAAETKWIVSQCSAFVGSRTHATIAAISSGVPTLTLAYSTKAVGLNHDIFGSQVYCIPARQISSTAVAERLNVLMQNADAVRDHLAKVVPEKKVAARQAAQFLRDFVGKERSTRLCTCRICNSQ